MDRQQQLVDCLLYVIFPLWLVAGIADYGCHRRTRISATSGIYESALHLLQAAQIGIALLAGLFLEINAAVLALMLTCLIAHTATAAWDVSYTSGRRYISPFEQQVHGYLEVLPFMAAALVSILYWPQFAALFGAGDAPADFSLHLKNEPLAMRYPAAVIASVLVFDFLPLLEELWRTLPRQVGYAASARVTQEILER